MFHCIINHNEYTLHRNRLETMLPLIILYNLNQIHTTDFLQVWCNHPKEVYIKVHHQMKITISLFGKSCLIFNNNILVWEKLLDFSYIFAIYKTSELSRVFYLALSQLTPVTVNCELTGNTTFTYNPDCKRNCYNCGIRPL